MLMDALRTRLGGATLAMAFGLAGLLPLTSATAAGGTAVADETAVANADAVPASRPADGRWRAAEPKLSFRVVNRGRTVKQFRIPSMTVVCGVWPDVYYDYVPIVVPRAKITAAGRVKRRIVKKYGEGVTTLTTVEMRFAKRRTRFAEVSYTGPSGYCYGKDKFVARKRG